MKLRVEVELGNEAMQTHEDVAEAVRRSLTTAADLVHSFHVGDSFHVVDLNGNTVGRWEVIDEDAERDAERYGPAVRDMETYGAGS